MAACSAEDHGITQPSPNAGPAAVFAHNTLLPLDIRTLLKTASSYGYDAPYIPMLTTLLPWALDDFTSATTTTIGAVSWQGAYCRSTGPGRPSVGPPRAPSTSSFQVWFVRDRNGLPEFGSTQLYEATLTSAEAHEQWAFDAHTAPGVTDVQNEADCAYYNYTAVLPMPFSVTAGTRYWLLIRADKGEEASWGWRFGRLDNSVWAHGDVHSGNYTVAGGDLAFLLSQP